MSDEKKAADGIDKYCDALAKDWAMSAETPEGVRAVERDAERYRFVRDNIEWLLSDEDGLPGLAYSCQIQLSVIEKSTPQELLDMIADCHEEPEFAPPNEQPDETAGADE